MIQTEEITLKQMFKREPFKRLEKRINIALCTEQHCKLEDAMLGLH